MADTENYSPQASEVAIAEAPVAVKMRGGDVARVVPIDSGIRVNIAPRAFSLEDYVIEVTRTPQEATALQRDGGMRFEVPQQGVTLPEPEDLSMISEQQQDAVERRYKMTELMQQGRVYLQKRFSRLMAIGVTAIALQQSLWAPIVTEQPLYAPQPRTQTLVEPSLAEPRMQKEIKPPAVAIKVAPEQPELPIPIKEQAPDLFEKYTLKQGEFPWMVIDRLAREQFDETTMDQDMHNKFVNALTSLGMGADTLHPGPAYELQPGDQISVPTEYLMERVAQVLNEEGFKEALTNAPLTRVIKKLTRPDLSRSGPGKVMETASLWITDEENNTRQ